jgi:hypothetical protein
MIIVCDCFATVYPWTFPNPHLSESYKSDIPNFVFKQLRQIYVFVTALIWSDMCVYINKVGQFETKTWAKRLDLEMRLTLMARCLTTYVDQLETELQRSRPGQAKTRAGSGLTITGSVFTLQTRSFTGPGAYLEKNGLGL